MGTILSSSSTEALIMLLIGICSVLIGTFWRKRTLNGSEPATEQES